MPIYEYKCPKCQHVFEEWAKVSEAHKQEICPKCGTLSNRLISHTSFVLKGGGWYVTDYGYRKNIKENQDSASQKTTESSESKTESKSASTSSSESKPSTGESKGESKAANS